MSWYYNPLDDLNDPNASPTKKEQALTDLKDDAPNPLFSPEALIGAGTGALLIGGLAPFARPLRRLAEKKFAPDLYAARQRGEYVGYPTTDWVRTGEDSVQGAYLDSMEAGINSNKGVVGGTKAAAKEFYKKLTPEQQLELQNAKIAGGLGLGGKVVGAGIGAGTGAIMANESAIGGGKMDENTYTAMIDVLLDKGSTPESKRLALEALKAQGENTSLGMSTIGQSTAYGALGTLLGGYAGAKLAKRAANKIGPDSELGALVDSILGKGTRKDPKDLAEGAEDVGEGLGDAIGMTIGGMAPFFLASTPESYSNLVNNLASSDDPRQQQIAADMLKKGHEKTGATLPWGELIAGMGGGLLGAGIGGGLRFAKQRKKTKSMAPSDKEGFKLWMKAGLGAGYGGAAGTAAGTYLGSSYEDPFALEG